MRTLADCLRNGAALTGLALLAACSAVPSGPPQATLDLPPAAPPLPAPAPVTPERAWDVADLTPGTWSYQRADGDSVASFAVAGEKPLLSLTCETARHALSLTVYGGDPTMRAMTIRTSNGVLDWPASFQGVGLTLLIATRPASDAGFDSIAFSRGRISVEVIGRPRLIVPVWAELARVMEDCRT